MAKVVKLADIASVLNVSTVTVSKALADKQGVSEEMREKIKVLAKEMGYRHPSSIKSESNIVSKNIGVIVSERYLSQYTSFYWELYQNVVTQGSNKDCFTLLEVLNRQDEKNLVCPKIIREKKVDGLIIIGKISKEFREKLYEVSQVPLLLLDFYDEKSQYDSVISDSYYGMYLMTNYLFEMGHKDIAYVGSLLATSSITDRYFGYCKSLLEHGVKVREEWVLSDRNIESGDIIINIPKNMPTAFVCNCDFVASILIRELNKNGYRVPEDISVVGFDNFLFPSLSNVGITTYEVDMKEMAIISVEAILEKIQGTYKGGIKVVEGQVIIKESVKDIR
nr:LacI family DNA-binding transcriptional regulator [uncultured Anaerocolumna sp.]